MMASDSKILLMCATRSEWSELKKQIPFEQKNLLPLPFYRAHFLGHELDLVQTGIGSEALQTWVPLQKYSYCLHFGLAGAMVPDLKTGDLIVSKQINSVHGSPLIPDKQLYEQVSQIFLKNKIPFLSLPLFTSDTVLKNQTQKQESVQKYGSAIVDMESYFVARLMQQYQIPYLSFRVVWDLLDWDLSNFEKNPRLFLSKPERQRATSVAVKKIAEVFMLMLGSNKIK